MWKRKNLTVREIRMAICDHGNMAQAGPSQQQTAGGAWRTRMTCPTCDFAYSYETPVPDRMVVAAPLTP